MKLFGHQIRLPFAILLLASLALTGNSYALGSDLISGRLADFDREMDGRYAALRACKERNERACDIDGIHTRPASFYVVDVSPDPGNWVNVSYARYFGVSQVRLKTALSPSRSAGDGESGRGWGPGRSEEAAPGQQYGAPAARARRQ